MVEFIYYLYCCHLYRIIERKFYIIGNLVADMSDTSDMGQLPLLRDGYNNGIFGIE